MANTFQCGIHNFSTDNIKKWDKHGEELEHEYDLHVSCLGCGKELHVKPNTKLSVSSKRIPRGILCKDCIEKQKELPEIKEAGEIK